jgi:RNA polymerase sigma-70 factor (ECF subfamily)
MVGTEAAATNFADVLWNPSFEERLRCLVLDIARRRAERSRGALRARVGVAQPQPAPAANDLPPAASAEEAREHEERALLAGVAADDGRSLRALFRRYYPRLIAFAERRLGDSTAAEEAVGDVFVEVWRNAAGFRGESQLSTWVYGIAHYKCLAAQRARRRGKRASVVAVGDEVLARVADDTSPEEHLEAREDLRRVREAVDALPAGHKEVVELAFFEGMPYGEVAVRLGITEDTVKTRIARARTRLRQRLSPRCAASGAGRGR